MSGVHPASHLIGTSGSFPGVKWLKKEADYSSPSNAQVNPLLTNDDSEAWSAALPKQLHHVCFEVLLRMLVFHLVINKWEHYALLWSLFSQKMHFIYGYTSKKTCCHLNLIVMGG
jgi:hypothetical protein